MIALGARVDDVDEGFKFTACNNNKQVLFIPVVNIYVPLVLLNVRSRLLSVGTWPHPHVVAISRNTTMVDGANDIISK